MDKFTVDLDQVLNDFEYSEFTDQYNTVAKVPDNSSSASASTQNITKHSINNVFHSLNEYLNTNVTVNSFESTDNNINNDSIEDFSRSNTEEKSFNEETETQSHIKNEIKETNFSLNETENVNEAVKCFDKDKFHFNANCENTYSLNNDIPQFSKENTNDNIEPPFDIENISKLEGSENHIDLHTELQNVVGNNFGINYEKNPTKSSSSIEEFNTVVGFEQALHLDDHEINKLLSELEEDDEINIDIRESQIFSVNDIGCETVNSEHNIGQEELDTEVAKNHNDNIIDKINNDDELKLDHNAIIETDITTSSFIPNDTEEELKDENCRQMPNSIDVGSRNEIFSEEYKENVNEKTYNETGMLKTNLEQPNDFNEETGLNKEVDKAKILSCKEITIENIFEENKASKKIGNIIAIEGTENNFEKEPTVLEDINKEIDLEAYYSNRENQSTEICSFSQGLPSASTEIQITDANVILNSMTGSTGKSEEVTSEILESAVPNNPEISKNFNIECLVQENELPVVESETEVIEFANCKQKQGSFESKSRPDNLPLETEIRENERKINLIGDPGSTPYNNVYVNNEFGKEKHNDNLNSSSSSTSPTFSDASSTASTASTEDIQFKHELNDSTSNENQTNNVDEPPQNTLGGNSISTEESGNIVEENVDPSQEIGDTVLDPDQGAIVGEEPTNSTERCWLGKEAPLWIPDSEAISCLHCDMKFTMLKRRHHCRACGLVLCSKCCHLRFRLEYLDAEARVCNRCHDILNKESSSSSSSDISPEGGSSPSHRPNPNNPLEYCSTISPLQQVSSGHHSPPAVMVPVGVLKRKGSNKAKSSKSVMFCDGIRPGSDLTNLDNDFNYNNTFTKKLEKNNASVGKINRNLPLIDSETNTFIPKNENSLPPTVTINKSDIKYTECSNNINTVNMLKDIQLTFAIHLSLNVHVKIINMDCCVNKVAWCFSTEGLINVGQDEIVILLEYLEEESTVPKDIFYHITTVYNDAVKGNSIKEMGLSLQNSPNFLDSKNHAGFIYIRPTFQCLENVIKPKDPFLIGILIHRWETPWAKLFPLRLILRLGAEYRYYPSPIISTRHRDSVYVEIGHTIINILADFRNFSYSLPQIRGLTIHMEEKITTVNIPINRYDQVIKSLNNSSDHILAFAGNFSVQADSHLVCIQDTQGNENCYSTHAINIHNRPRKITGASFIVFNGALKTSSGLTAKSNIIEDGLMIQVLPEQLRQIRESLRTMKDYTVSCGCVDDVSDEMVQIVWTDNDTNFNVGVVSTIDNMPLSGIPSIRVHNGKNYICHNGSRIIRWTEVFIIQNGEDNPKNQDPVDISRVSESIAKATCDALVKYIDLLIANNFQKIGIRVTLHVDNVSYCAGSNGTKLPPIYMKSLDNELIPVLHRITSNNFGENAVVLELIFRILNM